MRSAVHRPAPSEGGWKCILRDAWTAWFERLASWAFIPLKWPGMHRNGREIERERRWLRVGASVAQDRSKDSTVSAHRALESASRLESAVSRRCAPTTALRLVCISDTHGFHRDLDLPPGEILIHAGDFDGHSVEAVDDFNCWLGELPFRHKLVIAGNHDLLFDRRPKLARKHLTNAVYPEDSGIRLEGLNFWGSPVNSVLGEEWTFGRERLVKLRRHWDRIPDDTDVLITHKPPYGTLDKDRHPDQTLGLPVPARSSAAGQAKVACLRPHPRRLRPRVGLEHDPGQLRHRRQPTPARQPADRRRTCPLRFVSPSRRNPQDLGRNSGFSSSHLRNRLSIRVSQVSLRVVIRTRISI